VVVPCGLYYKPTAIVNDNSSFVNKLETSLTGDARVVIYDHLVFIVQPTGSTGITIDLIFKDQGREPLLKGKAQHN
jgi:hypothetical protein